MAFDPSKTQYVHRPFKVEAMQFDGTDDCADKIRLWARDAGQVVFLNLWNVSNRIVVQTKGNKNILTQPGWWVVKSEHDDLSVLTDEDFIITYDPIRDSDHEREVDATNAQTT